MWSQLPDWLKSQDYVAYAFSGLLVATYAWTRFNTPAPTRYATPEMAKASQLIDRFNASTSIRCSTRQALYRWSCCGYTLAALMLFVCLSMVLRAGPWRGFLLGPKDNPSLPAPLIATLAMTTLMSSIPVLQRLDAWLLACFHNWAGIPAEVRRRAAAIRPEDLTITEFDVAELRERYGDDSYGDTLARHLRASRGEGLELSQYRFTRVVKFYDQIRRLAGETRYAQFFTENADMFNALQRRADTFLRRSAGALTRSARLREVETPAEYEELMHERREDFAKDCRDVFDELALFLSSALLRSEATEFHIVKRLQSIGFAAAQPMNKPEFPINDLTLLGIALFVYLSAFSFILYQGQGENGRTTIIAIVTISRLAAIGSVLLLIQRYAFFQRPPGEAHRYFAYLVCGVLGAAAAAVVYCPLLWDRVQADPVHQVVPPIMVTGIICAVLAFCCNDWVADERPPRWLPLAEAAGCAAAVTVALTLMHVNGWIDLDKITEGNKFLKIIVFVGANLMAVIIGSYVPHIYRAARRAAAARAAPLSAEAVGPVPTAKAGQCSQAELGGSCTSAVAAVPCHPPAHARAGTFGNVGAPAGVLHSVSDASCS